MVIVGSMRAALSGICFSIEVGNRLLRAARARTLALPWPEKGSEWGVGGNSLDALSCSGCTVINRNCLVSKRVNRCRIDRG